MKVSKINQVYFSPNGGTKAIVSAFTTFLGGFEVVDNDLTMKKARVEKIELESDELLVIGFPVYADRLPTISDDIFNNIVGHNTPAVIFVSYGNRDYGDALLELKDKITKRGFKVIAACAAIAEHCLNTNIATDRPDQKDTNILKGFAFQVASKLSTIHLTDGLEPLEVPGNLPYKQIKQHKIPVGDEKCIQCGLCLWSCPVQAINADDFRLTASDICISCGKCIQVCPTHARDIKEENYISFMKNLKAKTKSRKNIEVFM